MWPQELLFTLTVYPAGAIVPSSVGRIGRSLWVSSAGTGTVNHRLVTVALGHFCKAGQYWHEMTGSVLYLESESFAYPEK